MVRAGGVFIVEDHEEMRMIYRYMLKKAGIEVCGESATGEEALDRIPALRPAAIIVDITLPGMDGLELVRHLRRNDTEMCVLIITGHEVERFRGPAREAGADDIASKDDAHGVATKVRELLSARAQRSPVTPGCTREA